MGVRAPFCLGCCCEELGGHGCDRGPPDVGDGGVVEGLEFPPVARIGGVGGSGERVK